MGTPTVPFYGRDADRLANLSIAITVLKESKDFLKHWPSNVANVDTLEQRTGIYQSTFHEAVHGDRRAIAQRIEACNNAGLTWQKIVNYACATEEDHSDMLERMGVSTAKTRRAAMANTRVELPAPDFTIVNLDQKKGGVKGSCTRDRRRYTYEVWVTEGDPRVDEGWYFKKSFGDCMDMAMEGFESGKTYSFRCRLIGRDNVPGPWSHSISIMVS
jgi:hypothetical protein